MTNQDAQSRRERRAARRRAQILEAAASVFAEQGFHRTTTKDIADAADIAEGTIYNYFASKDDLLLGILDHLAALEERREVMSLALEEDFRTFFARFLKERLEMIQNYNTLLAAVLPEVLSSPALRQRYQELLVKPGIEILEQHVAARREAGHIPPVDVAISSRLVSAMLMGLEILVLVGEDISESLWNNPAVLAEAITAFTLDGLGALIEKPGTDAESGGATG